MSQSAKPSIRTVTTQIKLKNLRAAAVELKRLEPYRRQFHHFDRLVASVHSPLNNAEKLLYEAHALIPSLVRNEADGDDPATRTNRTRVAISKLIKARQIVKDDGEINTLLKRCLAALEAAETKVSIAQSHAVRGQWDAAYQNIQEAARFDDSPDVQETRKYIAGVYKVHLKDDAQFHTFLKVAKITGALLVMAAIGAVIYGLVQRHESDQERLQTRRTPVAQAQPAPRGLPQVAVTDRPPTQPAPAVVAAPAPTAGLQPATAAKVPPSGKKQRLETTVTLNANQEFGTSLGKWPAGTKITLRYESGTWCAWMHDTGFSPDRPSEGGNLNRVAICGVKGDTLKVLALVGYKTQELPFSHTLNADFDRIILRINDETGSFDTNDGAVVYRVLVTPPAVGAP